MTMKNWLRLFLVLWPGLLASQSALAEATVSDKEAQAIAKDAYVYSYAMMENYQTWRTQAVDNNASAYVGGFNMFRHYSQPFTPDNKDVVTPNNDTPYSWAWLDLRAEPMVVSVPTVPKNRYYVMQWIDLFTQNFAYVGVRSTGFGAGSYMIAGPKWNGKKPAGIKEVFKSETEIAGTLTRTALQGPDDVPNVKAIQAQYKLQPLSAFLKQPAPPAAPAIDFPPYDKAKARTHDFIPYLNFLLQFAEPPVASEVAIRTRFEKIGIDPATLAAIDAGVKEGQAEIDALAAKTFDTNGLFGSRAQQKSYLNRAVAAMKGLYGNSIEEAWYGGYLCDGSKPSTVHFSKADLPPAKFFWSMTMYTIPDRFLYANPLNRYSIGDRTKDLEYGKDGSLTIYVSDTSPGKDKESNWLPAPAAKCSLVTRVYGPSAAAMKGAWKLPPLQPVAQSMAQAQPPSTSSIPVTVDNFIRAESDLYFSAVAIKDDAFGKFHHNREAPSVDRQTVIRLNRDTLYSAAVFDLDPGPVTITLPPTADRFMSMQVINEDQYTQAVYYGGGTHVLSKKDIGTRYVVIAVRTLFNPADPKDIEQVHALQDAFKISLKSPGKFEVPHWDPASQKKVRDALLVLASTLPDTNGAFGAKGQVDPVRRLIGAASAWGGNPQKDAIYLNITPAKNDGSTVYKLDVKDVPVNGFWSISLYNADGYYEKNQYGAYALNSITAKKGVDGSVAVQFGRCDGKIPNCLPIMKGWNYMVRLYRPRAEIVSGKWKFPEPQPVN
jgi:hypothetical protein